MLYKHQSEKSNWENLVGAKWCIQEGRLSLDDTSIFQRKLVQQTWNLKNGKKS